MFETVSKTLLSWHKDQYKLFNLKPGFILTIHTFGKDDNGMFTFIAYLVNLF